MPAAKAAIIGVRPALPPFLSPPFLSPLLVSVSPLFVSPPPAEAGFAVDTFFVSAVSSVDAAFFTTTVSASASADVFFTVSSAPEPALSAAPVASPEVGLSSVLSALSVAIEGYLHFPGTCARRSGGRSHEESFRPGSLGEYAGPWRTSTARVAHLIGGRVRSLGSTPGGICAPLLGTSGRGALAAPRICCPGGGFTQ